MIIKRHTKALCAGAAAIGMLAAVPAQAAQFYVRNCTNQKIYVCAYNEDNKHMWIAATAKSVAPGGDRERFHCRGRAKAGKHCKAFIGITDEDVKGFRHKKRGAAVVGGVGGAPLGVAAVIAGAASETTTFDAMLIGAEAVETIAIASESVSLLAAGGIVALGVAAGIGVGVGVVATVKGTKKNAICKKIRKGTIVSGSDRLKVTKVEDKYTHFTLKISRETVGPDKKAVLRLEPTLASGDQCPGR